MKVGIAGELGEGDFLWEEINLEDVAFCHGVGEVTLPAAVVFKRWTDVPTDLAVFAEGRARFGGRVGDDSGAGRGERGAIKIKLTE